jgi:hypothetical protein
MDAYVVPIVAMLVLAVVILGSELLMRSGRSRTAGSQAGHGTMAFKDCYDLSVHDATHEASRSFDTMCSNWPGA